MLGLEKIVQELECWIMEGALVVDQKLGGDAVCVIKIYIVLIANIGGDKQSMKYCVSCVEMIKKVELELGYMLENFI